MKTFVVILNYKNLANTLECIRSLKESSDKAISIVVVDNNSADGSGKALKKLNGIKLILNKRNLGYSGGNNVGIRFAICQKADYICVLNNDVKVGKHFIANLINTRSNSVISPKILFYPGYEYHKLENDNSKKGKIIWYAGGKIDWDNIIGMHVGVDEVDNGQYDTEKETDYATGACIFAAREIYEKVGLFDEKYFLYLEDMDFSLRAKRMGYNVIFQPKSVMWHKNAASTGGSGSKMQDYYISRNRLLFAFKYAKLKTKLAVLRQMLSQIKNPVKRAALFDFLIMNFGKGRNIK